MPCTAAPFLDKHTEYVYTTIFGMSDQEFIGWFLNEGAFS